MFTWWSIWGRDSTLIQCMDYCSLWKQRFVRCKLWTFSFPTSKIKISCECYDLVYLSSRQAGHRIGEHLERLIPLIIRFCRVEDDELREYCIQAFESFVRKCPHEITRHIDAVRYIDSSLLKFWEKHSFKSAFWISWRERKHCSLWVWSFLNRSSYNVNKRSICIVFHNGIQPFSSFTENVSIFIENYFNSVKPIVHLCHWICKSRFLHITLSRLLTYAWNTSSTIRITIMMMMTMRTTWKQKKMMKMGQ